MRRRDGAIDQADRRRHPGGRDTREIETVGEDVRGIAVHVAARVLSAAGANEVLVSQTTADLIEGSGLALEDLGGRELKGLPGLRRLYRVVAS